MQGAEDEFCVIIYVQDNAEAVSEFYNTLPNAGVAGRKESPIIHMRNINNWIKSVLINKAVAVVLSQHPRLRVLDLCCGKGGDLLKWKKHPLQHITGVGTCTL